MSANVQLFDSSISDLYQQPGNTVNVAKMYSESYPFVTDDNSVSGERSGATYTFEYSCGYHARPDEPGDRDDLSTYAVNSTNPLSINGFNVAGLMFSASDKVAIQLMSSTIPTLAIREATP